MQPCIKKHSSNEEFYIDEGCYITELSNSGDDPSLSIARARVEPGVTTQLHKVLETIERYVILEGEGLVEIEGLEPDKISALDVVIIPPQCKQRVTNTGSEDLVFLAICSPRFTKESYQEVVG